MIYFIQNPTTGHIKIGTTRRLTMRKRQIDKEIRLKTVLLGVMEGGRLQEQTIHIELANDRVHGEWFLPSERLVSYITQYSSPWDGKDESLLKSGVNLKVSDEYTEWLDDLVEHTSSANRSHLIKKALWFFAEQAKFKAPPKR